MNVKEVKKAHAMPIDEIIEQLETSKYGLYENEAKRRLDTYGTNEIVEKKGRTKMEILLKQINNPLNWILLIVAIITILIDHPQDAYVIFGVISINTIIGFIQEYKAENAIESLKKMGAPQAEVLRRTENDKDIEFEIPSRYVVPGDVLILNSGDKVPADARLFECMNLHVDESMLTGESVPVSKKTDLLKKEISIGDRKNMVFSGTLIVHGRAKAIVTKTGMQSEMGKIASIIQEAEEIEIPIKKGIKKLTKMLGLLALVLSISVFIIGLIKGIAIQEIMLFAVASAVSSIPEGLPIVVTVTLAIAVGKMAKRNAIIRKLKAVDTLGSISAIVSDKTGTLTTNQMTVRKIWTESHLIPVTGEGYKPKGRFLINGEETPPSEHQELQKIFDIMILCNDANLRDHKDEKEEYWTVNGDPTEGALIVAAMKADIEKDRYEIEHPRVDEIPFDSAHKYMATFHKNNNSSKVLTCVKGAPEKVLLMC